MTPRNVRLDLETQRRLQLLEAVARERVLQVRTAQALGLLELAEGRLDAVRGIEIYVRLHGLGTADGGIVADRVMAELAHREGVHPDPAIDDPSYDDVPTPVRLFRHIRGRLRGRVNTHLRRQIELHTGRSQVHLLHLHVEQALRFLDVLPERWPIARAVELYAERLGLDEPLSSALYLFVLERVARAELPPPQAAPGPPSDAPQETPAQPLRIVTSGW